jgi:hypothetical protein
VFLAEGTSLAGYRAVFTPRISVSADFTDNLFTSKSNRETEYITVISPGFTLELLEKDKGASLSYDMGYSCYDRFVQFNTLRHNVQLTGWFAITEHSRLDFKNAFMLTEETAEEIRGPAEEPEGIAAEVDQYIEEAKGHVAEKEVIRRSRDRHYTNTATLGFTYQFNSLDSFNARYGYHILENEDPYVEDKITHNPSAGLIYWFIPNELELKANFSFKRDEGFGTPEEPGYWEESVSPSAALTYWVVPREVSFKAGISHNRGDVSRGGILTWYRSTTPTAGFSYWSVPHKAGIDADISHTAGQFSDSSDDFENWHGKMKLTKKFSRHLEGNFQYDYTAMDFNGADNEDYKVHAPSVGVKYMLAEDLPFTINVAYIFRDKAFSDDEAFVSLNGDFGKTWAFSRYGTAALDISSGYDESYFGAEKLGFGVYYDAKCRATYAFNRNFSGDIFGLYRTNKYVDLDDVRNDKTKEAGSGITFQEKWLSIRLEYLYRSVDSTVSENDYEENRIRVRVMLSPDRPIRINN